VDLTEDWRLCQSGVFVIESILSQRPSAFGFLKVQVLPYLYTMLTHERAQVREATVVVLGNILKIKVENSSLEPNSANLTTDVVEEILTHVIEANILLNDSSSQVKIAMMRSLEQMMKTSSSLGRVWVQSLTSQKPTSLNILSTTEN
jgi:hypothetical protein